MTFASLFGPLPTKWPHPDEVKAGMMGYLVDPLVCFVRDWRNDEVTFYEGARRPVTVIDVSRLRSGFISSVVVRDEVDGATVRCRRLPAKERERMVRNALPPGHSPTKYELQDGVWTSTPRYFAELLGYITSGDEWCGYAMPARVDGVDRAAWEKALAQLALKTPESRRVSKYLDYRLGVRRALRLGDGGSG